MIPTLLLGLTAAIPATITAPPVAGDDADRTRWSIHAEKIYAAPGETRENATVYVDGGKITRIRSGSSSDIQVYAITAGLVDASVRITEGAAETFCRTPRKLFVKD